MLPIRTCRLCSGALWAAALMLCTAELGAQQHLVDEGGTVTACDFYFLDDGGALGDAGTGVDHLSLIHI